MSKTRQKELSAKKEREKLYEQGYNDGYRYSNWPNSKAGFRWKQHPYINNYRCGYKKGRAAGQAELK